MKFTIIVLVTLAAVAVSVQSIRPRPACCPQCIAFAGCPMSGCPCQSCGIIYRPGNYPLNPPSLPGCPICDPAPCPLVKIFCIDPYPTCSAEQLLTYQPDPQVCDFEMSTTKDNLCMQWNIKTVFKYFNLQDPVCPDCPGCPPMECPCYINGLIYYPPPIPPNPPRPPGCPICYPPPCAQLDCSQLDFQCTPLQAATYIPEY